MMNQKTIEHKCAFRQDFLDDYTIDRKTVNADETILKGRSSNSYILMKQVVIPLKQQFKQMVETLEGQKQIQSEYILRLLNYETGIHVQYDGTCSHKLITFHEYSSHSLKDEVDARNEAERYFSEEELWSILCSSVYALAYLQKINIGHGCVSTNDIYLNEDGTVKLADPSIATSSPFIMTQGYYYSPEILGYFRLEFRQQQIDIFKSDVFSLGMTMLELCLLTTCQDCYDYEQIDVISKFLKEKFNSLIGSYSKQLLDLLYQMLSFDCEVRPSFIELEKYLKQMGNQMLTQSQQFQMQAVQQTQTYEFGGNDQQDFGNCSGFPVEQTDIQNIDNLNMNETLISNRDLAETLYPDTDHLQAGSFKTPQPFADQQSFAVYIKESNNQKSNNSFSSMNRSNKSIKSSKSSKDIKNSITKSNFMQSPEQYFTKKHQSNFQEHSNLHFKKDQEKQPQVKILKQNVAPINIIREKVQSYDKNIQKRTSDAGLYTNPQLLRMMKMDVQKILNKRSQVYNNASSLV